MPSSSLPSGGAIGAAPGRVPHKGPRIKERCRDALEPLPLIPAMAEFGSRGPSSSTSRELEQRARRRANRSIKAIQAMWGGSVAEADLSEQEGWKSTWAAATPSQRRISLRILRQQRACAPPLDAPQGKDAFRRLTSCSPSPYLGSGSEQQDSGLDELPKRALCPVALSELSLPQGVGPPLDPREHSDTLAEMYENSFDVMVKPKAMVDRENKYDSIRTYRDPALDDPSVLLETIARMHDAQMVTYCQSCEEEISLFTVVKKTVVNAEGVRERRSRLVWDERKPNERFHRPPRIPLGSPASFSNWDLAESSFGRGKRVVSFTADLPDWFYRVALPERMLPFFVFGGVTVPIFTQFMQARGTPVSPPPHAQYVCLRVPPMGWSWAPFIAHTLMLELFEQSIHPIDNERVEDGMPVAQPRVGRPAHWGYMDDFGALGVVPAAQTITDTVICDVKERAVARFQALGVVPHKLTLGDGLDKTLAGWASRWARTESYASSKTSGGICCRPPNGWPDSRASRSEPSRDWWDCGHGGSPFSGSSSASSPRSMSSSASTPWTASPRCGPSCDRSC